MKGLILLGFALALVPAFAQVSASDDAPLVLDDVIDFVSVPKVPLENVIQTIKVRGLGFEFNETALSHILNASIKGKREPTLTAKLILQMLQVCPDCRSRYFGEWTKQDLETLLANKTISPGVLFQEVQFRGIKGISKTTESIEKLKRAGASKELIAFLVPADEIPTPTPPDFQPAELVRAPNYNPKLRTGSLSLIAIVKGHMEFFLSHNGLFTRALKAQSEAILKLSTFTAPVPKGESAVTVETYKVYPRKKKEEALVITKTDGGFKFKVNETDKEPHIYEIKITFSIPSNP